MNDMTDQQYRLKAISLLDGRNWDKVGIISDFFSEYALIRYRVRVEISYLIFLSENTGIVRKLSVKEKGILNQLWKNFSIDDGLLVKKYEKKINHDVKAVEYFIRNKLERTSLIDILEFIHFCLTSYDVNIPAYGLMIKEFRREVLIPTIDRLLKSLKSLIIDTKSMMMLGRTHGQPALPTTMGKELAVYYKRIKDEIELMINLPIEGKVSGAVGNYNSFYFIDKKPDWIKLCSKFIVSLGLKPNVITTQILHYDSWLRFFDSVKRLNNLLTGFSQDVWWYISMEYFLQKKKEEEVGSSTMSHKINPITFENAEGNFGIANSMFEYFVRKLSISRLQRDLSDSTVKRDFGLAFGFTLLALDSLLSGMGRISPNPDKMKKDLEEHWEIYSEGIQTYLRYKGYKNAYELLKEKTRGKVFDRETVHRIIKELPISEKDKKYLMIEDLKEYSGIAEELAEMAIK